MPDIELNELIHRCLDGVASPDEQASLDERLEREPEARRVFDEMKQVHRLLSERAPAVPPADLRQSISAEVRRHATSAVGNIDAERRRRSVLRIALGIAAVFAIAFMLGPLLTKNVDTNQVGGTMAPRASESSPMPVVEPAPAASIVTESDGRNLSMKTVIEIEGPGRLEVTWVPGELELTAVSGSTSYEKTDTGVVVEFEDTVPELRFERLVPGQMSLNARVTAGGVSTVFPEVIVPASTNF